MMSTRSIKHTWLILFLAALALVTGSVRVAAGPESADPNVAVRLEVGPAPIPAAVPAGPKVFDLCASDGTLNLPDATSVPVWGFVDTSGGPCTPGLITSLPGPELRAVVGDSVTINLSNALAVPTSILIAGQTMSASGGSPGTFTTEAPAGGSVAYTFTAGGPGSFLYESGTDIDRQIAMGLYGALIVESGVPGQAYGPGTDFELEATLVLSEIDPALNANPAGFDMLSYKPRYWLINGEAYPDTDPIPAPAGSRLLLRYLNAGFNNLAMSVLGSHQRVIAKDAYQLPSAFSSLVETIPAGQGMDAILAISLSQPVGSRFAISNRNIYTTNGDSYPGGMLTFVDVGPTVTPAYGVLVSPASDSKSGDPGTTVTYTLDVTNTGSTVDSYTVSVSGNAWITTAPASVGPLAGGTTAQISVDVEVPSGAAGGDSDTAVVMVTSVGDAGQSDSSSLTTIAATPAAYGVSVVPDADSQSGYPGETVTYTLDVTNTGSVVDSFMIAVTGNAWVTSAPASVGPLLAGATAQINVDVTIPAGAIAGDSDTASVAVTSVGDSGQSDAAILTTTALAAPTYGVSVSPDTDSQSGAPGATVSYTLDVTNTGNVAETFDVEVVGNAWAVSLPTEIGPISAGDTVQLSVDVIIPVGVVSGDSDTATVIVTSQVDNAQWDSSDLTTTAVVADLLYFSTLTNAAIPGVPGPYDDADIYAWDGTAFSRVFDASIAGLPGGADVDGLLVVDGDTFYLSFNNNGGVGVPVIGTVQDEDIVLYDAGTWSLFFDGNEVGLGDGDGEDVDGFEILADSSLVISTTGAVTPDPDIPGAQQDEDLLRCEPTSGSPIVSCNWSWWFDGSDVGLAAGTEDVIGLSVTPLGDIYLSTQGAFSVTGLSGDGSDVFACLSPTLGQNSACASFSMYFDGSASGLTDVIDALDLP
jgi:FtsP/CotA-like multicopper oxidase with cupredoxin domain